MSPVVALLNGDGMGWVIVGVFVGIAVWGFAGLILGPLVLALLFTLIKDLNRHKDLWK